MGFAVGLMLIVTPGMTFKNYNPLAVVANAWCLLEFVLAKNTRSTGWRAWIGGLVLGMTWLLRIDLGTFFTVLWLGVILARMFERGALHRWKEAGLSLILIVLGTALLHAPVVWDANSRGYLDQFLAAYPSQWKQLVQYLDKVTEQEKALAPPAPAPVAALGTPALALAPADPAKATAPPARTSGSLTGETLPRMSLAKVRAATGEKREQFLGLFLLTYLPLLSLIPLAIWAAIRWLRAVTQAGDTRTPLAALALVGSALTLFPQYFFWRPDAPHLSEFGPGFWCCTVGACALLGAWGKSWLALSRWLVLFLVVHAGVWLWRIVPDRWCGTVAARADRSTWFEGANGVRIWERGETAEWLNEVRLIIAERSQQGDYLVTYPYHPAFNIISNRRTYERDVYTDNTKAGVNWNRDTILRIEKYRPKVIIVSGWSVNGTVASRFKNWAGPVYAHIRSHYENYGGFGDKKKDAKTKTSSLNEEDTYEVFVRRNEAKAP
jgi:hypothetical protein